MSANDCCKVGVKWDGTSVGREGTLGQNQTYITGTNKDVCVLIVHDIFGWTLPNTRLLADHFAQEVECTCYVPDFFGGNVIPEKTIEQNLGAFAGDRKMMEALDLPDFLARNSKEIRTPELVACAKELKSKYKKVGAVGHCWGGWGIIRLGAKDNNLIECLSTAHPSYTEKVEIDALGVPTQILAPEHDLQLTPDLKEYCNMVIPGLGIPYQYDFYPGLFHGFAVKGDQTDAKQKAGLERSKRSIVTWLREFLH